MPDVVIFGSTQQVTEVPESGFVASAIVIAPSDRLVGTPNLGTGQVSAWIGTGVTEALYTNGVAPAPTVTAPTQSTSVGGLRQELRFARLVRRDGREYLAVKVTSRSRRARISVSLYGRSGRRMSRVVVLVATGRTAIVRIDAHRVARIRVQLLS